MRKLMIVLMLRTPFSCNQEEETEAPELPRVAEDAYNLEMDDAALSEDVTSLYLALFLRSGGVPHGARQVDSTTIVDDRLCKGAQVSLADNHASDADTLVVIFPSEGCMDTLGVHRKGKVSYIRDQSTTRIVCEDYHINGHKVEGDYTAEILSNNTNDIVRFELKGGKITYTDGTVATRSAQYFVKILAGDTLYYAADDQFITLVEHAGDASKWEGVNRLGQTVQKVVTNDLVRANHCNGHERFLPVAGTETLTIEQGGVDEVTIDYGVGGCDQTLTVAANGVTIRKENVSQRYGTGTGIHAQIPFDLHQALEKNFRDNVYINDFNEICMLGQLLFQHADQVDLLKQVAPNVFCQGFTFEMEDVMPNDEDTVTLNFAPCAGDMSRSGKIKLIARVPDNVNGQEVVFSVNPQAYTINDVQISGTYEMKITYPQKESEATAAQLKAGQGAFVHAGGTTSFNMDMGYTFSVTEPANSFQVWTDTESTFAGNHYLGHHFDQRVETALHKEGCAVPGEGKVVLTISQNSDTEVVLTLDYGSGSCDYVVTVALANGQSWKTHLAWSIPGLGG